jgi:hypothetical protein
MLQHAASVLRCLFAPNDYLFVLDARTVWYDMQNCALLSIL